MYIPFSVFSRFRRILHWSFFHIKAHADIVCKKLKSFIDANVMYQPLFIILRLTVFKMLDLYKSFENVSYSYMYYKI